MLEKFGETQDIKAEDKEKGSKAPFFYDPISKCGPSMNGLRPWDRLKSM